MSLENWEQDLAAYRAVLEDFNSGKLKLQQGQDEFVADLKRRILILEEKLGKRSSSTGGSSGGDSGSAG